MTFYELYKMLDERYPTSLRCEWDNDGIMCTSSLEKEVKSVDNAIQRIKKKLTV